MNKNIVLAHIRAMAAMAESLAYQLEADKLWDGDLQKKLSAIREELRMAESEAEVR